MSADFAATIIFIRMRDIYLSSAPVEKTLLCVFLSVFFRCDNDETLAARKTRTRRAMGMGDALVALSSARDAICVTGI